MDKSKDQWINVILPVCNSLIVYIQGAIVRRILWPHAQHLVVVPPLLCLNGLHSSNLAPTKTESNNHTSGNLLCVWSMNQLFQGSSWNLIPRSTAAAATQGLLPQPRSYQAKTMFEKKLAWYYLMHLDWDMSNTAPTSRREMLRMERFRTQL